MNWVSPDHTASQWTILDGLPSNTINALTQDNDRYLWLGTNEGLIRVTRRVKVFL